MYWYFLLGRMDYKCRYINRLAVCLFYHINMINMQILEVAINPGRIDSKGEATGFMECGPTSCR